MLGGTLRTPAKDTVLPHVTGGALLHGRELMIPHATSEFRRQLRHATG